MQLIPFVFEMLFTKGWQNTPDLVFDVFFEPVGPSCVESAFNVGPGFDKILVKMSCP
jgi:hypothetical protein